MGFPENFIWAAASSAYQIEGAIDEGGRGYSVWDMFSRIPGKTWQGHSGNIFGDSPIPGKPGHSGDVAADHYHRFKEDVSLMKEMGLKGYRLSIAWPRILPEGIGKINLKGLAFYDQLIDELLIANIRPFVTLFHWDLPYPLHCRGGWLNREIVEWFGEFTQVVVDKLSDRVRDWMPMNELKGFIGLGHEFGLLAPGERLGFPEVLLAAHHALMAHGKSVQVIRARSKTEPNIGQVTAGGVSIPVTEDPKTVEVARQDCFAIRSKNVLHNTWWLDPLYRGHYPEDGLKLFEEDLPDIHDGDMELIHQPLDFFGLNVYEGKLVQAGESGQAVEPDPPPFGEAMTNYRFPIRPGVLYWGPKFFHERYQTPIYITENGMSNMDWIDLDGNVHDPQRIDFLRRYLRQLKRACDEGIDVRGYFHWSVMDIFEWHEGYRQRFGLVYVDYPTGKRILKDSAHWYKEVIGTNGGNL